MPQSRTPIFNKPYLDVLFNIKYAAQFFRITRIRRNLRFIIHTCGCVDDPSITLDEHLLSIDLVFVIFHLRLHDQLD